MVVVRMAVALLVLPNLIAILAPIGTMLGLLKARGFARAFGTTSAR